MLVLNNPFFILGASVQDAKESIHEKADEKSFSISEEVCRKSEQVLVNPRKRLSAEVAWFPGVATDGIDAMFVQCEKDFTDCAMHFSLFDSFHKLAYANVLSLYIERFMNIACEYTFASVVAGLKILICELSSAVASIDAEKEFNLINHDRVVAGFPEIPQYDDFEVALDNHFREYKALMIRFFSEFDVVDVADSLTIIVEKMTKKGNADCPWMLLVELISDFEMKAMPEFIKLESDIDTEIRAVRREIENGRNSKREVRCLLLSDYVKKWDRIAQPIQVLLRSQGKDHERSKTLAEKLRKLALFANNECNRADVSMEISTMLFEVFAELRGFSELVKEDIVILRRLLGNRS